MRLKGYDYSQAGLYFITLCCDNRQCLFGEIKNGVLVLNKAGKITEKCWIEIPNHFPNAVLHEYIIMPNHVHGIVELKPDEVGAENFQPQLHQFQKMIPRSIGSIVKGFKIGVTKWFRQHTDIEKVWQRNYHDHIIRNKKSYHAISNYILNNPANWKSDKLFSQ